MRVDQITFTRFLAAMSIVVFHFGDTVFPFSLPQLSFLFKQANVGVNYFFILSGYVMILAYGKKSTINIREYLINRLARIYPVYLLAILCFLLYLIIESYTIDYQGMFLNILAIQSWVPGNALSFNRPGWTISVELLFYLSFPFLFNYIYRKYTYKKLMFPILLFWGLSQVLLHAGRYSSFYGGFPSKSHDLLFYFPLMHLNEFLIGNLAGLFFMEKLSNKKKNVDIYLIISCILLCLALKYNSVLIFHNGVLMIIFIPMILLFSINDGIITRLFNKKAFIYLGEISYGIYILQKPIYLFTLDISQRIGLKNEACIFYTYLITLVILSIISYQLIETPLREKIKKMRMPGFFLSGKVSP